MTGIQYGGTFDKLARSSDLRKETRQSDNLSDAEARSLQTIRQAIVELPADASLTAMIDDDSVDAVGPREAAARFTAEIEEVIRGRQFGRAIETSLQKGFMPYDFLNNRR
jgi:hypothetical protein